MARVSLLVAACLVAAAAAAAAEVADPEHFKCEPGKVTVETTSIDGKDVDVLVRGPGCPDEEPVLPPPPSTSTASSAEPAPPAAPARPTPSTTQLARSSQEGAPLDSPGDEQVVIDSPHMHLHAASAVGATSRVQKAGSSRMWLLLGAPLALVMVTAALAGRYYDVRVRQPRKAAAEALLRQKEAEQQAEELRLAEEGQRRQAQAQEEAERRRAQDEYMEVEAEREEAARALREVREAAEREAAQEAERRQREEAARRQREEAARLDRERRAAAEEEARAQAEAERKAQEEAEAAKAQKRCGPCSGCGCASKPTAAQPAPAGAPGARRA